MDINRAGHKAINIVLALAVGFLIAFLSTDSRAQSGNVYNQGQIAGSATVGMVVQVREVAIEATSQTRTQGAALGAALAGLAGRKQGWQTAALIATLGGLGGHMAAQAMGQSKAQELVVAPMGRDGQFDMARLTVVVQPEPYSPVHQGQTVLMMGQGGQWRITAAGPMLNTEAQAPAAPRPTQWDGAYTQPTQQWVN